MDPTLLLSRSRAEEYVPALVRIPAGWFLMGCDIGQDNEKPVHRVWVDEFLLAARQVTNVDYGRFLRDTASLSLPPFWSDPAFNHPEQPVVGVSWHEAVRYCEWLSASTGGKFRLPTEAEWERAARGGNEDAGALFPWGDAPPQSLPGYADRCASRWKTGPEPVGQADTNGYGLYNMCDMRCRPSAIHAALKSASGALPGVDRGATTSRCRAAQPAPASRRSFDTQITGSESRATYNCRSEVRGPIAEVKPPAEKELPKAKALTSAI
jgi:hypothetical protein